LVGNEGQTTVKSDNGSTSIIVDACRGDIVSSQRHDTCELSFHHLPSLIMSVIYVIYTDPSIRGYWGPWLSVVYRQRKR